MKHVMYGLLLSATLLTPAVAQTANPNAPAANAPAATTAPAAPAAMKHAGQWRTSKMIGLNVYNQQNEKLGDVNEILMDNSGKVVGYVLGVGGFLGMGEHDVLVQPDQVKFVNEPIAAPRTASAPAADRPAADRPAADRPAATTGTANTRPARAATEKWYPDHAVFNASKDQLKAMPQFKYSAYN